jgi:hypothetical protein
MISALKALKAEGPWVKKQEGRRAAAAADLSAIGTAGAGVSFSI